MRFFIYSYLYILFPFLFYVFIDSVLAGGFDVSITRDKLNCPIISTKTDEYSIAFLENTKRMTLIKTNVAIKKKKM